MNFCHKCGNKLLLTQKFCSGCGISIFTDLTNQNSTNRVQNQVEEYTSENVFINNRYVKRNEALFELLEYYKSEFKNNFFAVLIAGVIIFLIYYGLDYLNEYVMLHSSRIPIILPISLFISGLCVIFAVGYIVITPFVTIYRNNKVAKIKQVLFTQPTTEVTAKLETEKDEKGKISEKLIVVFNSIDNLKISVDKNETLPRPLLEYCEIINV